MRYQLEPRREKYIKRFGLLSFARRFGYIYGKKLMDTATKTGVNAAKFATKRVVQKTAEVTGGLIGNKIADKITLADKSKSKEKEKQKEDKRSETEEIYIPPEKIQRIIGDLRLF